MSCRVVSCGGRAGGWGGHRRRRSCHRTTDATAAGFVGLIGADVGVFVERPLLSVDGVALVAPIATRAPLNDSRQLLHPGRAVSAAVVVAAAVVVVSAAVVVAAAVVVESAAVVVAAAVVVVSAAVVVAAGVVVVCEAVVVAPAGGRGRTRGQVSGEV